MKILKRPGTYQGLESLADQLQGGLIRAANQTAVSVQANHVGSMFTLFFTPGNSGAEPSPTWSGRRRPRNRFPLGQAVRSGALLAVLLGHAATGNLSTSQPVRSRLPLHGPHPRRYPRDGDRRRPSYLPRWSP